MCLNGGAQVILFFIHVSEFVFISYKLCVLKSVPVTEQSVNVYYQHLEKCKHIWKWGCDSAAVVVRS